MSWPGYDDDDDLMPVLYVTGGAVLVCLALCALDWLCG